jgi:uncharacterized protein (DUF1330 family)
MAKGYWIIRSDARLEGSEAIGKAVLRAVRECGARIVVLGGPPASQDARSHERHSVIEFANYEKAVGCYRSSGLKDSADLSGEEVTVIEHAADGPIGATEYFNVTLRYALAVFLAIVLDALAGLTKNLFSWLPTAHVHEIVGVVWLILVPLTFIGFVYGALWLFDQFFDDKQRRVLIIASLIIAAWWHPLQPDQKPAAQHASREVSQ